MSAAHNFLTIDRFERLYTGDSKPHFEYWFGEAVQKSMPTLLHSVIQLVVSMLLVRRGWFAAPELRLKLSALAHPVPDVAADSKPLHGPYPTEPFELCVEIVSPGDDLREVFRKSAHCLDWGIRRVWIIDPEKRGAYMMSIENPQPMPVGMGESLVAGPVGAEIFIPLSEVFAEADQQLGK